MCGYLWLWHSVALSPSHPRSPKFLQEFAEILRLHVKILSAPCPAGISGMVSFPRNAQLQCSSCLSLEPFCSLIAQLLQGTQRVQTWPKSRPAGESKGSGTLTSPARGSQGSIREDEAGRAGWDVPHHPMKAIQRCHQELGAAIDAHGQSCQGCWSVLGRSSTPGASSPEEKPELECPPCLMEGLKSQQSPR